MIKLLILVGFSLHVNAPQDSIGVETVNGKTFVIHRVDEKETLFAISRRYKTTVDAILEYNKEASNGLEIGQILKVPYTPAPKAVYRPADGILHTVVAKETMYSISKKYNVTLEEIRQWNNLPSSPTLSIGQQLSIKKSAASSPVTSGKSSNETSSRNSVHTVGASETIFSIARQYGITQQQLKEWNNLDGNELKIGQTLYVTQPGRGVVKKTDSIKTSAVIVNTQTVVAAPPNEIRKDTEPVKPPVQEQTIKISETYKNGSETVEAGLAELIEGTEGNRKYLALHRTAPVGTILKVKNEMNNREVFVRVMGKLPDTALTDKLIIRISKSAYDRLGAIDQRFRVEVTYYK